MSGYRKLVTQLEKHSHAHDITYKLMTVKQGNDVF